MISMILHHLKNTFLRKDTHIYADILSVLRIIVMIAICSLIVMGWQKQSVFGNAYIQYNVTYLAWGSILLALVVVGNVFDGLFGEEAYFEGRLLAWFDDISDFLLALFLLGALVLVRHQAGLLTGRFGFAVLLFVVGELGLLAFKVSSVWRLGYFYNPFGHARAILVSLACMLFVAMPWLSAGLVYFTAGVLSTNFERIYVFMPNFIWDFGLIILWVSVLFQYVALVFVSVTR